MNTVEIIITIASTAGIALAVWMLKQQIMMERLLTTQGEDRANAVKIETKLTEKADRQIELLRELTTLVRETQKDSTKEHGRLMEFLKEDSRQHRDAHKDIEEKVSEALTLSRTKAA